MLAGLLLAGETRTATLVLRGLTGVQGVAVSPQGLLFVSLARGGGEVARVVGRDGLVKLAEIDGEPAGLAFDAEGMLYVADRANKAVRRITPWGDVKRVADGLNAPEGVTTGRNRSVFVSYPAAGRVTWFHADGSSTALATDLPGASAIAASAENDTVYVSDREGTIWRIERKDKKRSRFASLEEGRVAALALDEAGSLYAAVEGPGRIAVFDPTGKETESIPLPGPKPTGLAFGGLDLKTLFVTEATTGALYRLAAPYRSQRLPWETDQPVRILEPPDGAILNRHDGEATTGGLRITVRGLSKHGGTVLVNGVEAPVEGGRFETTVVLGAQENEIVAEAAGGGKDKVIVLWDRHSYPRYRFSTDDNIWFLRDIARHAERYKSIFENEYLAMWRDLHRKYGARIHFNIYYETDGFNLSQMPDKFHDEWKQNADWIRLTFHAKANDPDRPYIHASAEKIRQDFLLVTGEIIRFAGREVLSPFTTVHWGETTLAGARALREEGVVGLAGYFDSDGEFPRVSYYLPLAQWQYASKMDYWKDTAADLLFVRHDIVINTVPLEQIVPHLERLASDPHQSEVMELMIHEQYFYPDYRAYEPDYRQRCERAIEWVTRRGYKPVFYEEGFLGAAPR